MKNERYNSSFLVPDFVDIQRKSFFHLLKSGILEEFSKVNPIVSDISKLKLTFYPENFLLILPDLTVSEAILEGKTYSCKLYVPAAIDVYKTKGSRRGFDDQGLKGQPVVSSLKKQRSSYVAPSLAGDSNVTPSTARASISACCKVTLIDRSLESASVDPADRLLPCARTSTFCTTRTEMRSRSLFGAGRLATTSTRSPGLMRPK